ncbi:MAG: agmatine/peptidylarginine deiminase [Pirellulaceae bacterium]|jgi:agmatine/peptidylarginine deiminase
MKKNYLFVLTVILLANVGLGKDRRIDNRTESARNLSPAISRALQSVAGDRPVADRVVKDVVLANQMPGEFERQGALLVASKDLIGRTSDLFVEIVRSLRGKVEIVVLVSNVEEYEAAKGLLGANSVPLNNVHFVEVVHDTMWARDYGPIICRTKEGSPIVIDSRYDLTRVNDDQVPTMLARLLGLRVVQMPLRLDGGNLLSNGQGLGITTRRLLHENAIGELEEAWMHSVLQESFGFNRVVVLEPLVGEPTGHVDMFATFTSANTVVVGRYDPSTDAENAAILDRNAIKLAGLPTVAGPLRVVRIPMPPHDDAIWRTYANVIYANGVLLVPTYGDVDQAGRREALATYASLLPRWNIVSIDARSIIELNGALHCLMMNLGPLGVLPEFPLPRTRTPVEEQMDSGDDDDSILLIDNMPYEAVRTSRRPFRKEVSRPGVRNRCLAP